jgi:hypothetical protein
MAKTRTPYVFDLAEANSALGSKEKREKTVLTKTKRSRLPKIICPNCGKVGFAGYLSSSNLFYVRHHGNEINKTPRCYMKTEQKQVVSNALQQQQQILDSEITTTKYDIQNTKKNVGRPRKNKTLKIDNVKTSTTSMLHSSFEDTVSESNSAGGSKEKKQMQQSDKRQCIDCGSESTYINKKKGVKLWYKQSSNKWLCNNCYNNRRLLHPSVNEQKLKRADRRLQLKTRELEKRIEILEKALFYESADRKNETR